MEEAEPFDEMIGSPKLAAPPPSAFPSRLGGATQTPHSRDGFAEDETQRLKSYEEKLNSYRAESELGSAYQFRRSESDVTGAPKFRYQWRDEGSNTAEATRIRTDALRMLDLADGAADTPTGQAHSFRRTDSCNPDQPYYVGRTQSGGLTTGVGTTKVRVPGALSGLNLGSAGIDRSYYGNRVSAVRQSYPGVSYEDDILDEEETLVRSTNQNAFPENRGGSDGGKRAKSTWSSRYSLDRPLLNLSAGLTGKEILADMEKE